jgi:hypothetical protein
VGGSNPHYDKYRQLFFGKTREKAQKIASEVGPVICRTADFEPLLDVLADALAGAWPVRY